MADHDVTHPPRTGEIRGQGRRGPGRTLAVAVGFLTRLPTKDVSPIDDEDLRLATAWFPLVGLVVGALSGVARWVLDAPLGSVAASVVAVAVGAMATGAFHEDGWADTFDGLWGGWTPERRIEIMRDSRVGTYGALALLLVVLLQVSLLVEIPDARDAGLALVAAHLLGRTAILWQIRLSRPATDQGSGARVAARLAPRLFWSVVVMAVVVLEGLLASVHPWAAPAAVGGALVGTLVLGAVARHKIGGVTGDVLGATAVAALTTGLATTVALLRLG